MERGKADGNNVAFFNFKPYAYVDEKGALTGEQVEILREVLSRM